MEVGTHAEQLKVMATQPDFLEAYADRELTVFGITGRLQDLAGMCPVDLSDPRVTLEAKNEFVVKVANESGMEIAPEHETYFSQVVEKQGQERKFTVAATDQSHHPEQQPARQRPDAGSHAEASKVRARPEDQSAKLARPEALKHRVIEPHDRLDSGDIRQAERGAEPTRKEVVPMGVGSVALATRLHADAYRRSFNSTLDQPEAVPSKPHKAAAGTVRTKDTTSVSSVKKAGSKAPVARRPALQTYKGPEAVAPSVPAAIVRPEAARPAEIDKVETTEELAAVETGILDEPELIAQLTSEEFAPEFEELVRAESASYESDVEASPIDISEFDQLTVNDDLTLPSVVLSENIATEPTTDTTQPADGVIIHTIEQAVDRPVPTSWEVIVEKEPLEICDEFTFALQTLILESDLAQVDEDDDLIEFPADQSKSNRPVEETKPQQEPVPPVPNFARVITDRLHELVVEEKRIVAPVLREVLGTALIIEALEQDEDEPEVVEAVLAQLEEHVICLFEELGITYTPEDIEQFIYVLLRPDFRPLQHVPSETPFDPRTEGTHEAKGHSTQLTYTDLDEVDYAAGHLLGKVALFYTSARNRSLATVT